MYVIVWRFTVAAENRPAFEAAYASSGPWARLFARADGFLGTELLRPPSKAGAYLTVDRWRSEADFEAFQAAHGEAYRTLDLELEGLAAEEIKVGVFTSL